MTHRLGLAPLALAALALPALAEGGPTKESIDRMVKAIEAQGCILTEDNQDKVLAAAKLTLPEAEVIVSKLVDDGKAEFVDADVRLTSGKCAS